MSSEKAPVSTTELSERAEELCRREFVNDPNSTSDVPLASPEPVESGGSAHDTRIDWATLLKRVHDVDALACPCGGRLRVIALITEPEVVGTILTSLYLPAAPPPIARARSPAYDPAPD